MAPKYQTSSRTQFSLQIYNGKLAGNERERLIMRKFRVTVKSDEKSNMSIATSTTLFRQAAVSRGIRSSNFS